MNTFEAFGLTLPLEILLALGFSVLIAVVFLAIVAALSSGRAEGGEVRARQQAEDDADAAFESAMRMINGDDAYDAMDPMVERIVAIVQNAIVEAEAVELDECEAEFLADPMHFGRRQ